MSDKLNFVPHIKDYQQIREMMDEDFSWRINNRFEKTSLGIPLYWNINLQMIITQECPYHCPFCLERQNTMKGDNDFKAQLKSLKQVLKEHPTARLSITGGEPSLYIDHIKDIVKVFKENGDNTFLAVATTLYNNDILNVDDIMAFNVSHNDFVKPDLSLFNEKCCYQTILDNKNMNITNIKKIMDNTPNINKYSFRFLTDIKKSDYSINIFNEIQNDKDFIVKHFKVGDFFVYLTFKYGNKTGRITLGDMFVQQNRKYNDFYSNIIIHPDGKINTNWR